MFFIPAHKPSNKNPRCSSSKPFCKRPYNFRYAGASSETWLSKNSKASVPMPKCLSTVTNPPCTGSNNIADTPPLPTNCDVDVPLPFVKAKPAINCTIPLAKGSNIVSPLGGDGNCHSAISVGFCSWNPKPSSVVYVR